MTIFRLTYLAGMTLLAGFVAAGTANADPIAGELMITSGTVSATIALAPITGTSFLTANYNNTNFNGWNILALSVLGGTSSPPTEIPVFSASANLSCLASACPSDPLDISFSVTGMTSPVDGFQQSASQTQTNTSAGSGRTQQGFWDTSDALFGTASSVPEITLSCPSPPNPNSCSQTGPLVSGFAGPSPYSMTLLNTFTMGSSTPSPGVTPSIQFTSTYSATPVSEVIPEPSTWSLLGMSFAALGGIAYRRHRSA